jgi:hypothetical protein
MNYSPTRSIRALGHSGHLVLPELGEPPAFGELINVTGYPVAFAASALFPLLALPLVPASARPREKQ